MPTPILTVARQAVWSAIDNWPALSAAGVIRRKFKLEGPGSLEPDDLLPALGDLPSLAIIPAPSESPWKLNKAMALRYSLQIELWTRHWDLLRFEFLWEEIVKALFQAAASGEPPYIEAAVGQCVEIGPFTTELGTLPGANGQPGPKARRSVLTITVVNESFNPMG